MPVYGSREKLKNLCDLVVKNLSTMLICYHLFVSLPYLFTSKNIHTLQWNFNLLYDESSSMTELHVGIAATPRRLEPAAWRPYQHACALSLVTAKQSVSVARRPPWPDTALGQGRKKRQRN